MIASFDVCLLAPNDQLGGFMVIKGSTEQIATQMAMYQERIEKIPQHA